MTKPEDSSAKKFVTTTTMSKLDWSNLSFLYIEKNLSLSQIAEIKNCHSTTVLYHIRKQKISVRTLSQSVKLDWSRYSDTDKLKRISKTTSKNCGRHLTEEHKAKISVAGSRQPKGIPRTDIERQHISEGVKKWYADMSSENKAKMKDNRNSAQRGKRFFELHPEVAREQGIKFWLDLDKARKLIGHKPNKSELRLLALLNKNFPSQWKYVGNGKVWLGHRCPDFMNVDGKKQLIELFGIHWHNALSSGERTEYFKQFGFDTLVIWEEELKSEVALVKKIKKFSGAKAL